MNVPITKKEMEFLPKGYTPTQFPNRKARRDMQRGMFSRKNKILQVIEFIVHTNDYKYQFKDTIIGRGIADPQLLMIRRLIFHDKTIHFI